MALSDENKDILIEIMILQVKRIEFLESALQITQQKIKEMQDYISKIEYPGRSDRWN